MLSKNQAIVYAELNRRAYPVSIETLSRICGMNHTLIGQALSGLQKRGLVKCVSLKSERRIVYRSKQLPLPGVVA